MSFIKMNGEDYGCDRLLEKTKAQPRTPRFAYGELQRLKSQSAVLKMARSTYGNVLLSALAENQPLN